MADCQSKVINEMSVFDKLRAARLIKSFMMQKQKARQTCSICRASIKTAAR